MDKEKIDNAVKNAKATSDPRNAEQDAEDEELIAVLNLDKTDL